MKGLLIEPGADRWPEARTDYEALALAFCREWTAGREEFVLHTSGSTGTPKPIQLSRRQMAASAHLTGQTFGLVRGDRALVCLNIRYIAGIMMLVRGLELGLPMTVIEPSADPLVALGSDEAVFDFAAFVPLQLRTLLERSAETVPWLDTMKAILVGGAAVDPALTDALQRVNAPVYSTYGMTETVSHIAVRRVNGPGASTLFTALNGVTIGLDERSCLNITAAATDFACIQTNDVAELLDSRHFRILGRADSIINTGGVKIQPEQVEEVVGKELARMGTAARFFVYGMPNERLGQQVFLFLEETDLTENESLQVKKAVREALGSYAVPRQIRTLPQFHETPTGKIDRKATVARYLAQPGLPQ